MFPTTTFKEWSAWVMLLALTIGSLAYFRIVYAAYSEIQGAIPPAIPFIAFTIIVVLVSIVGHIIAALTNLSSASDMPDERDRYISRSASHWSGLILGFCVVMGLIFYIVRPDGTALFHAIFAGLVISQMSEYVLQIIGYRRSSSIKFQDAGE